MRTKKNGLSQKTEPTSFHTPTGPVRINEPQENDTKASRNNPNDCFMIELRLA